MDQNSARAASQEAVLVLNTETLFRQFTEEVTSNSLESPVETPVGLHETSQGPETSPHHDDKDNISHDLMKRSPRGCWDVLGHLDVFKEMDYYG